MMVLEHIGDGNLHYYLNICEECKNIRCDAKRFQQNFKNWTSGNNDINKFIQDTQLSIHSEFAILKVLEWIPYDRFCNIKYIAKGGFGKVYKANWIDGHIVNWNNKNQDWVQERHN